MIRPRHFAPLVLSIAAALPGCSRSAKDAVALPNEGRTSHADGRVEVISQVYDIDRIYRSMTGPWSTNKVQLVEGEQPELVWITGCHVEMVGPDGATSMPEQFMCHANLDFDVEKHGQLFNVTKRLDGRLFTLSQGQLHVAFPKGFGIPVMSNEALDLATQVLNLNVKDRAFQVRHKVHVDFVRDRDAAEPMKPLYECGVSSMVSLEGRSLVFDQGDEPAHGPCKSCCIPGAKAVEWEHQNDSLGRMYSGHWVVKPGREENRTRATTIMALPFDTTVHHIAVHLHPFAESLELRDVTAGTSIFKSHARNLTGQIGLAQVDYFSSAAGVPLPKDHEYELVSVYNNTTDRDQDSMAVMYLYLLDKEFKKPEIPATSSDEVQAGGEPLKTAPGAAG